MAVIVASLQEMFNNANYEVSNILINEKTKKQQKAIIINKNLKEIAETQLFSIFPKNFLDEGWARRLNLGRGNIDLEKFANKKFDSDDLGSVLDKKLLQEMAALVVMYAPKI